MKYWSFLATHLSGIETVYFYRGESLYVYSRGLEGPVNSLFPDIHSICTSGTLQEFESLEALLESPLLKQPFRDKIIQELL